MAFRPENRVMLDCITDRLHTFKSWKGKQTAIAQAITAITGQPVRAVDAYPYRTLVFPVGDKFYAIALYGSGNLGGARPASASWVKAAGF